MSAQHDDHQYDDHRHDDHWLNELLENVHAQDASTSRSENLFLERPTPTSARDTAFSSANDKLNKFTDPSDPLEQKLREVHSSYVVRQSPLSEGMNALDKRFKELLSGGLSSTPNPQLKEAYMNARGLIPYPTLDGAFAWRTQATVSLILKLVQGERPFPPTPKGWQPERFKALVLERICMDLCVSAASAIVHGGPEQLPTIKIALERLTGPSSGNTLERYPALLLLYTTGIAAMLSKNSEALYMLLRGVEYLVPRGTASITTHFDLTDVLSEFPAYPAGRPVRRGLFAGDTIELSLEEILSNQDELTADSTDPFTGTLYAANTRSAGTNSTVKNIPTTSWHEHIKAWIEPILSIVANVSEETTRSAVVDFELLRLLLKLDIDNWPSTEPVRHFFATYDETHAVQIESFLQQTRTLGSQVWFVGLFRSVASMREAMDNLRNIYAGKPFVKKMSKPEVSPVHEDEAEGIEVFE